MDDKIKEKIRKLLALARDSGASEHEAALAMERAQQIALEHAIDIESVQTINTGPNIVVVRAEKMYQNRPYYIQLACAAAELYFGQALIRQRPDSLSFTWVGTPDNVEFAQATFDWLIEQVERWYKTMLPKGLSVSARANYRRTFKWACSARVRMRVGQLKPALPSSSSRALVVVDTLQKAAEAKVASMNPNKSRSRPKAMGRGTLDGMAAGEKVQLRREIAP